MKTEDVTLEQIYSTSGINLARGFQFLVIKVLCRGYSGEETCVSASGVVEVLHYGNCRSRAYTKYHAQCN